MADQFETPWMREQVTLGLISRVEPSLPRGAELVSVARKHLTSARSLAAEDPTLALTACHDAARKAIDGLAGAHGLRIESSAGHHKRTLAFGAEALGAGVAPTTWDDADRLRDRRNDFEYGRKAEHGLRDDEIGEHIATAEAIVDAVAAALRPLFPPPAR